MVAVMFFHSSLVCWANPSGEVVISGNVGFERNGDTLKVLQDSNRAIIQWQDFSIGSHESTVFQQLNSSSATLNRVMGQGVSLIDGKLSANGEVWIINQNGIVFGGGSVVDVGGLLASTLDVSNAAFMNGNAFTLSGNSSAPIINRGKIELSDGSTAIMAARRVENHGVIGGVDSQIFLVGANDVLVNMGAGGGHIIVSGTTSANGTVVNTGQINGGNVTMEAVNNNLYAMAIQNQGVIRANSSSKDGGRVRLVNNGVAGVETSGVIDASGEFGGGEITISSLGSVQAGGILNTSSSNGNGGVVAMKGSSVSLAPDTTVNALGGLNGGSVQLGDAETASVSLGAGSSIQAGGIAGNGGQVDITASGSAVLGGEISVASTDAIGGRVDLNAGSAYLLESSEIDASGGFSGGRIVVESEELLVADGDLYANGGSGLGGNVTLQGEEVSVTSHANIEANGGAGGGQVYIGGGFGGKNTEIENAANTFVADGATVKANATEAGNGGQIVVWSDGVTMAMGAFEAQGAGANGVGGLVELSGLENLQISGQVNTYGQAATGTLLLDPVNITLGSTGITAGAVDTALANSHVVIHTAAVNQADPGELGTVNILRDFDLVYDSANHFTILAHGDINVGSDGVSNELLIVNRGSGNISMVAGWDGGGSPAFVDDGSLPVGPQSAIYGDISAADILPGNVYGWGNGGSIYVNADATHRVEVGSAGGETNFFADNIVVQVGDNTDENTQIGFNIDRQATGTIDGDINLYAKSNLLLFGRDSVDNDDRKELQIGHGGNRPTTVTVGDLSGDITMEAGGAIVGYAARRESYLQVGHGGWGITGNMSGDIALEAAIIQMEAGMWNDSWVQVGHGGRNVRGHHSGDISVIATTGSVGFTGSRSQLNGTNDLTNSYAMIGHGGVNSDGNFVATPDLIDQYTSMVDDMDGNGTLTIADNFLIQRVDASGALLFLDPVTGLPTTTDTGIPLIAGHSGDINVQAAGNVTMYAGGGTDTFAKIGHGGRLTMGAHRGDINVEALGGNVIFDRYISSSDLDRGARAFVQVGHGGSDSSGGGTGDINVAAANRIEFYGGRSASFAQIGHGGRDENDNFNNANADFAQGTSSGDISVIGGGTIKFRSGFGATGSTSYSMIGHGGYESYAMPGEGHNGDIYVESTGGSIDLLAGADSLRPGQDPGATVTLWGANPVTVATGGYEGNLDISFTMIGHGGDTSRGDHWGDITVVALEDVSIEGTGGYEGIGFLNAIANGSTTGQNDDTRYGDPVYATGANDSQSGVRNFAQIGHGGYDSDHANGSSGSVQIGFGNKRDAMGALTGEGSDINVIAGGNVRVVAAQKATQGPLANQINVTGNNFDNGAWLRTVTRADGTVWYLPAPVDGAQSSYAMIGHGGRSSGMATAGIGHNGDITVLAGGSVDVIASDFERGLEPGIADVNWIPSPITDANGNEIFVLRDGSGYTTDVNLYNTSQADRILNSGNGSSGALYNFAQIGHGGFDMGNGDITGNISVTAFGGDLNLLGGNGNRSYAQIGHGGVENAGSLARSMNITGNIGVDVNGSIAMKGGTSLFSYTQIGHAGVGFANTSTTNGFITNILGDVNVLARNGNITLEGGDFGARDRNVANGNFRDSDVRYSMIGHGGWDGDMNATGNISVEATLGNVYLEGGDSRGDFAQIGHGGFSFDAGQNGVSRLFAGNVAVTAGGDVSVIGGSMATRADLDAVVDNNGVTVFDSFSPGNYDGDFSAHAQIGHGGGQMGGSNGRGIEFSGNVDVTANNILVQGGDGDYTHALIGHGGNRVENGAGAHGVITVTAANDITLQGGYRLTNLGISGSGTALYNSVNYAQIGMMMGTDQGNRNGNTNADIFVTAGNDISLLAGGGVGAHAIIGNGSSFDNDLENLSFLAQTGNHEGNITVAAGGNLTLRGADAAMADPLNGVDAGDDASRPGGFSSAAQIGNGGPGVSGQGGGHSGNIDVRVGGDLVMTTGSALDAYAKIGHGDYLFVSSGNSASGFIEGDISVAVGGSATLNGAMIGHVDPAVSSALSLYGNTYIGVARNPGSTGALSVNAANGVQSSLTSSITGDLRLYMTDLAFNQIAPGSLLNGSAYKIRNANPALRLDEWASGEFGFTYDAFGIPQGGFTPLGTYNPNASFGRYVNYYGPVIGGSLPGKGGNGGGGGGFVPPVKRPVIPAVPPFTGNPENPPFLDPGITFEELLALYLGTSTKFDSFDRALQIIGEEPGTYYMDRGLWTTTQIGEEFSVTYMPVKTYDSDGDGEPDMLWAPVNKSDQSDQGEPQPPVDLIPDASGLAE